MSRLLKRWESPRREGRNDKGKGGSARQRQLKKQTQMLRQRLKDSQNGNNQVRGEEKTNLPLFSFALDMAETGDRSSHKFIFRSGDNKKALI